MKNKVITLFLAAASMCTQNSNAFIKKPAYSDTQIGQRLCENTVKVCDIQTKVCDIQTTVSSTEVKVCDIQTKVACASTPITQAVMDAANGDLTLKVVSGDSGNYCLAEDVTGDIVIDDDTVSLDLNEHLLTGLVTVNGSEAIVKNGFIFAPKPTTNGTAALTVAANGTKAQLIDMVIECEDTTANNVDGRAGIENNADKSQIINCCVQSGAGGNGINNFSGAGGAGGIGGIGINNSGSSVCIQECKVTTGAGGTGGIGSSGTGGTGGIGGTGINNSGSSVCIQECKVTTGAGGDGPTLGVGGGDGGAGGDGIVTSGLDILVRDNVIKKTGAGGAAPGGSAGTDGRAIFDTSTDSVIAGNMALDIPSSPQYVIAAGNAVDDPGGTALAAATTVFENVFQ